MRTHDKSSDQSPYLVKYSLYPGSVVTAVQDFEENMLPLLFLAGNDGSIKLTSRCDVAVGGERSKV